MRRTRLWVLLGIAAILTGGPVQAQDRTVEGTLVDSKCYLSDNSLTGNDHGAMKQCGTMCLKGGSPAAVLTADNQFHALIAPSPALAPYVGQKVRVNGTLHNGALLAESVEVNKNGKWEAIKLGAMM